MVEGEDEGCVEGCRRVDGRGHMCGQRRGKEEKVGDGR